MTEFIGWQQFEKKELLIDDVDNLNSITIDRDENFNIIFELSCSIPNLHNGKHKFEDMLSYFKPKLASIKAHEKHPNGKIYIFSNLIVERTTLSGDGTFLFLGKVLRLETSLMNKTVDEAKFENVWLLNSPERAYYDQNIKKTGRQKEMYQWGDFAKDKFDFSLGHSFSWGGIKLNYKDYNFLLVQADSFANTKASFLRFKKKQFPSDEDLRQIINILNFVFGMTFIFIGYTKYNCKSSPINNFYTSTMRKDIQKVLSENQLPVIPIRLDDFYGAKINTTDLINSLLKKVSENSNYNFIDNFAYINYARTQPADVKIQPLASTFDNICEKYFSGRDNKLIPSKLFADLQKNIKEKIEMLPISADIKKIMISKIPQINNQSINQRNIKIFDELEMEISDLEKKALKARNNSVHGSIDPAKKQEIIILGNCYYTLINRLILKLLDIPLYIDYSIRPGIPTKTEEAQKGNYTKPIYKEEK